MKTLLTSFSLLFLLSTAAGAQSTSSSRQPLPEPRPVGTAGPASAPAPVPTPAPADKAAPKAGANAAPAATVSADYRLVPGDKLRVEVYKDTQVSQSVQIRPDGKITLPLANDVAAAGKTPTELRDSITESLKAYIANPTVTVIVVETVPPVVYV